MNQKRKDLRFVFAAVATAGLRALWKALKSGRVIHGRFVDSSGNGCLFHWCSQQEISDRFSRQAWFRRNPLLTEEHDAAMRRIIVGWDAAAPQLIVKGAGYEAEYPEASYVVQPKDVRAAIKAVMRERREANQAEKEAQPACV